MRIAVIGLGNMGQALARTLAAGGRDVVAWNRTPRDLPDLVAAGVRIAPSLHGALTGADVVLLISLSYDTTDALLRPVAGKLKGKLLLQMCTGLPEEARRFAAWAGAQDAEVLDVGIMGYPSDIGSERMLLLFDGDKAMFDKVQPLLAPLGPRQRHVGRAPGLAKTYDNAILARNYAWMLSYLQSAAIAQACGLDTTLFTELAMDQLGPLYRNVDRAKQEIAAGGFRPATQASLAVHHKALGIVQQMAQQAGARTPILAKALAAMERAIAAGHGDREIAACFTAFLPTGTPSAA